MEPNHMHKHILILFSFELYKGVERSSDKAILPWVPNKHFNYA